MVRRWESEKRHAPLSKPFPKPLQITCHLQI
nr:MAG TPA: hypothetical protein [Caudoviricetes sp.]